jgi:biopolymer transport protein ExbB/TolQ
VEPFLSRFNNGEVIALVSVAGGLLVAIVAIIGHYWHEIRRNEIAGALKQEMINRGMTADQIRMVLDAGEKTPEKA